MTSQLTLTTGARGGTIAQRRRSFLNTLFKQGQINRLWLPDRDDSGTSTIELSRNAGTINWRDSSTAKNVNTFTKVLLGAGIAYTFDGTNDNGLIADSDIDSYGDGANDSALSVVALINFVNDSAAKRIIAKDATNNREWRFEVNAAEQLLFVTTDEDQDAVIGRKDNNTLTSSAGNWIVVGGTYNGGGVDSSFKIFGYEDGTNVRGQIDDTTSGSGSGYVAMENLGQGTNIGTTGSPTFNGQIAFIAVYPTELQEKNFEVIAAAASSYFDLSLI